MALISRVMRLFRADLHAVLDSIEEPELLLRQAIREMEEEVARQRQRVGTMGQRRELLKSREAETGALLSELEEQLEVCFDAGNDELARTLIRRRLEEERSLKALQRGRGELEKGLDTLSATLEQNRTRLEEMKNRAELLVSNGSPSDREEAWAIPYGRVRDEDVEVAFLREKRRRMQS